MKQHVRKKMNPMEVLEQQLPYEKTKAIVTSLCPTDIVPTLQVNEPRVGERFN